MSAGYEDGDDDRHARRRHRSSYPGLPHRGQRYDRDEHHSQCEDSEDLALFGDFQPSIHLRGVASPYARSQVARHTLIYCPGGTLVGEPDR